MKTAFRILVYSVLLTSLTACSAILAKPTSTPTLAPTSRPTDTATPEPTFTPTLEPTVTTLPPTVTSDKISLPVPSGKPLAAWEGIPIMPAAISGDGDSSSYTFVIKAAADEVKKYYDAELPKIGYAPFASGQGTTGAFLLMYMKGTDLLTLSIIPQADGTIYVMFVK